GRTLATEFGGGPDGLDAGHRLRGKIMGADEQRIIVQGLRARWFVVGVIQTHKSIPQERSELTAGILELSPRSRVRPEHSRYIGSHLYVSVMSVVDLRRPFRSLPTGENGARHLKLF